MFSLSSKISELPGVGSFFERKFAKLNIHTVENLFYHVPARYIDYSKIAKIAALSAGETVTIHAKINSITNIFSKRGVRMQIGSVEDETGKLTVVWFNQPYLIKMLYPGRLVSLSGKVGFFNRKLCLTSPDYELLDSEDAETTHTGRLLPIYHETAELSSKVIRSKIKTSYNLLKPFPDFLPNATLTESDLVTLDEAIKKVHFPNELSEVDMAIVRLAFNEMLLMHLRTLFRKSEWRKNKPTFKLTVNQVSLNKFINSLAFKLTESQDKAIKEILRDLEREEPMNRLLEGDVGSGKTIVAAVAAYTSFLNGYQTIVMAPTQILAEQHFKSLSDFFSGFGLTVELITSDVKKGELGISDIVVGTHALIHKRVKFSKVALVIIDEQHRFGVEQREHLIDKSSKGTVSPHILTLTATPIPRTIALTSYGDMELSVLTDMPKGRKKITTWVVPETKREGAYKWIGTQIKDQNSQVFWICPLIEESEKETMEGVRAVSEEFVKLSKIFEGLKLGLLHGKVKPPEKNRILQDFKSGKINILVSTPVVEVGIDIPGATIMVIEAAERFGLASLHQLRGRVGRNDKKSYCLLFSNIKYSKRLKAMEKTHSGFELAELDLKLRGPGEIFGTLQSGFSELKVASWSDFELIKKTRVLAEEIIKNPKKFPLLLDKFKTFYA